MGLQKVLAAKLQQVKEKAKTQHTDIKKEF